MSIVNLRFVTYNILDGATNRERLIVEILQEVDADVILLQEIVNADFCQELSSALNMSSYIAMGNSKRKLALLSKVPILAPTGFHPFPLRNTLLQAQLKYSPDCSLTVFGVHLAPYPHLAFELWRLIETMVILRRIGQPGSGPIILAGDFNAVAATDTVDIKQMPRLLKLMIASQFGRIPRLVIERIEAAGFADSYRLMHRHDTGNTLPAHAPHTRLDYIFVNRTLVGMIRDCRVVDTPRNISRASDHLPLLLELELDT